MPIEHSQLGKAYGKSEERVWGWENNEGNREERDGEHERGGGTEERREGEKEGTGPGRRGERVEDAICCHFYRTHMPNVYFKGKSQFYA